jgi:tetratricopeptide (TPR) repeat protein
VVLVNLSHEALVAVQRDPRHAQRLASAVLDDTCSTSVDRVEAMWALGRACHEQGRVDQACRTLGQAVELAVDAGLPELEAGVRGSLSTSLLAAGDTGAARAQLVDAEQRATGAPLGRLLTQRALIDLHVGALDDARAALDEALPLLVAGGDDLARCRLLANRGVVHIWLGELRRAEADLTACHALAARLDQRMIAAGATHNLGVLHGRRGDVPTALEWFGRARVAFGEIGFPGRVLAALESDLCAVLLMAGLHREARAAADRATQAASASGNMLGHAEAELLLGQVCLAQTAYAEAEAAARRAGDTFRRSERTPWAALADYVALGAAAGARTRPAADLLDEAAAVVDRLDEHGWRLEALEVRTFMGRVALELGRLDEARRHLAVAASVRRSGSSSARANAWLATARLRLAEGNRSGAKRALVAGMAVVDQFRSTLGATDLRAHASARGADLAQLGLQLAVEDGRSEEVLAWAERWHAGALQLPPARPPTDGALARALVELRQAHATARQSALAGASPAPTGIAGIERRIRDLSRAVAGSGASDVDGVDAARVASLVGDGALVEYVTVGDDLHAVVVVADGIHIRSLCDVGELADDVLHAVAALRRLAISRARPVALDAARQGLVRAGTDLAKRLIDPLDLPPGPVVIVPTGPLQALPWSVLPGLGGRDVTVTPSASLWCRETGRPAPGHPRVLLVAGPDLPGGDQEISRISRLYHQPVILRHPEATVGAVLGAMGSADIVHLAAHGTYRADSPLFSSLRLSDGPLTVYDLEQLSAAPSTVVLPACDAAVAAVRRGDELIGAASALIRLGVRTVVAPLTAVPDDDVVPLVVDLHQAMRRGLSASAALGESYTHAVQRGSLGDLAAASAFVAVGSH